VEHLPGNLNPEFKPQSYERERERETERERESENGTLEDGRSYCLRALS
jgi:hypothetical protein